MRTDYVQMLLCENLDNVRYETGYTLDSIEREVVFIKTCIESNTVPLMEATTKEGPIRRAINTIKKIFDAFVSKAKGLVEELKGWEDDILNKLTDVSYDNVSISAFPHWDISIDKIMSYLNPIVDTLNKIKPNAPSKTPEEIVNELSEFRAFRHNKEGYRRMMKIVFSTGEDLNKYKSVTIDDGVKVKDVCETAKKYILEYDGYVNKLVNMKNKVERYLIDLDKKSEIQVETYNPYLILEGTYLSNTDLQYCTNMNVLFEADEPSSKSVTVEDESKQNNQSNNTQQSNAPNTENNESSSNYTRNLINLVLTAITTAISVAEEKLYVYRAIVRSVVSKGIKKTNTNVDSSKKKEEPKEKTNKDLKKENRALKKARKENKKEIRRNKISKIGNAIDALRG